MYQIINTYPSSVQSYYNTLKAINKIPITRGSNVTQRGTGTLTYKQIVDRSFGTSIGSGFFKFMITE